MRIGVMGTGDVGRRIASRLVEIGHDVCLGSRTRDHQGAAEWVAAHPERASASDFAGCAAHGELVFLCVKGEHAEAVLRAAGESNLGGKVVVDVTNPLDFSGGFPPRLSVCNDDSAAEQLQRAFGEARFVKALNTVANTIMVAPRALSGPHHLLICGDDADAKALVQGVLMELGWAAEELIDLGGLDNARGTEAYLLLWTRLYRALGTGDFNIRIVRADVPQEVH